MIVYVAVGRAQSSDNSQQRTPTNFSTNPESRLFIIDTQILSDFIVTNFVKRFKKNHDIK